MITRGSIWLSQNSHFRSIWLDVGGSNFSHVGVLAYLTLPFTIHTYRQYMEFNHVSRFVYTLKSGVPSTDYCICVTGTDTGMKGFSCCRAITIFMYLDERWKRYSSIIDSTNSNVKRLLFDSWFDVVGFIVSVL